MTRVARDLLLVSALLVVAGASIYRDLSSSNRPHELVYSPLVAALLALSAFLSLRLVVRTRPVARAPDGAPRARLWFGAALVCACVSVLLLGTSLLVLVSFLTDRS